MFFKTLPIKFEEKQDTIQIFNDDKTYIILKKLKNISFETLKDQNYTIYLQTKEKIYSELEVKIKIDNIFRMVNQSTDYFFVKRNDKISIFGLKDLDKHIFNYIGIYDAKNLCCVNKYFYQIGKEFCYSKIWSFCGNDVAKTVGIKGNPLSIYTLSDYQINFFKLVSQCIIEYKEYADEKGFSIFQDRRIKIFLHWKAQYSEEQQNCKLGKYIKIIFPSPYNFTKEFSSKRAFRLERIFKLIALKDRVMLFSYKRSLSYYKSMMTFENCC